MLELAGFALACTLVGFFASLLAGQRVAKVLAALAMMSISIVAGVLLGFHIGIFSLLFLVLSFYFALTCLQIIGGRLLVRSRFLKSFAVIGSAQLICILIIYLLDRTGFGLSFWLVALAAGQILVALLIAKRFSSSLGQSAFKPAKEHLSEAKLPTLTVAIPAKDESSELLTCLESVVSNDYLKLEVLVLDDAAGSKTGEVIRAFAHDGVRFVLGEQPDNHWLAKNFAYERLAKEANGELILFCGVDVRFGPDALTQMVRYLLSNKLEMLNILPTNLKQPGSLSIQPMRYLFELARPWNKKRQPVLSTCWLIRREFFMNSGGMGGVRAEVVPERHFAKRATGLGAYSFVRADEQLKVMSSKPRADQAATTVRTRYPLLGKKPLRVMHYSLFIIAFGLGPYLLFLASIFVTFNLVSAVLSLMAIIISMSIYGILLKKVFATEKLWLGFLIAPALLRDLWLSNLSMCKYEFGHVFWKGRDTTLPVMQPRVKSS